MTNCNPRNFPHATIKTFCLHGFSRLCHKTSDKKWLSGLVSAHGSYSTVWQAAGDVQLCAASGLWRPPAHILADQDVQD